MKTTNLIKSLFLLMAFCQLSAGEIMIKGSDTLGAKMVPQLMQAYMKLHPEITFRIVAEGSSTGFKALLEGECDIGMASRPASQEELEMFKQADLELHRHTVAHDAIIVIVHPDNPLENISLKDLERIFTGELRNWSDLGGKGEIQPLMRNSSSGTYKVFQNLAMSRKKYGANAKPAKFFNSNGMRAVVAEVEGAIGYMGAGFLEVEGVKVLSVNGETPTRDDIRQYPISRELYFYTTGETRPEVSAFISWVKTSEESLKIIKAVGFIPVKPLDELD
jgi:phosphate transport system substrate-binding protein